MRYFYYLFAILFCSGAMAQNYQPIVTPAIPMAENFHDQYLITDNYQWLEDVHLKETKKWIHNQNRLSTKYLKKCSNKTNAFLSINRYAHTTFDNPIQLGDYYFHKAYYGESTTSALFYRKRINGAASMLVNPNFISRREKVSIEGYKVSKYSDLLAYQFSRGGSDWKEIKVVNLKNAKPLKDHLTGIKFSNIAWLKDGFFYATYEQDGKFGVTNQQKVWYHKIGTPQSEDELIFKKVKNPNNRFRFDTSSDERFFFLKEINEEKGICNIFYMDFTSDNPKLQPLFTNRAEAIHILDSYDDELIAVTSHQVLDRIIVKINPANPFKLKMISPNFSDAVLLKIVPFSDRIVTVYQNNQKPFLCILDYEGNILKKIEFQMGMSLNGLSGNYFKDELFYYLTDYALPPVGYQFNIQTFTPKIIEKTGITYNLKKIVYEQKEFTTEDGVSVSMLLVYKKGLEKNGNVPTILKAYGGFGIVSKPAFDPGIVHFIKEGGLFAFANIRGGGDRGYKWAKDGRGINKQNSFDDFIEAAEFLIEENYTNPKKLAITGGSNGGLVVAVAAIQRPDLFKAVVPVVAPLDMLRFEQFTIGTFHKDEYGTVSTEEGFENLYSYSPYHNIKDEVNYPSMLLVTSENDDRVPPFHSYKFAARLQSRPAQKNPILLRVWKNAGHSGVSTLSERRRKRADIYGFMMYELMEK